MRDVCLPLLAMTVNTQMLLTPSYEYSLQSFLFWLYSARKVHTNLSLSLHGLHSFNLPFNTVCILSRLRVTFLGRIPNLFFVIATDWEFIEPRHLLFCHAIHRRCCRLLPRCCHSFSALKLYAGWCKTHCCRCTIYLLNFCTIALTLVCLVYACME